MPYIDKAERKYYDPDIEKLAKWIQGRPGELSYIITAITHIWLKKRHPMERGPVPYSSLSLAIGALESTKLELYRKVIGPYEDRKLQENGRVSDLNDRRVSGLKDRRY